MNFHKNHWLLLGTIFFGYIILVYFVAIGPAISIQQDTAPLPAADPMTHLQRRGLAVYISEGCAACHTQQVRPLPMDQVWGRPSVAADYAYIRPLNLLHPYAPAVLGSERTGPDLTTIGERQPSKTWQYIHLYNPRAVSPDSVMPAFPWLFRVVENPAEDATVVPVPEPYAPESGKVVVDDRARALVAYLLSLKQAPLPGSYGRGQTQAAASGGKDGQGGQETAASGGPGGAAKGAALYSSHCASCHQANGQGLPGVFPPLAGDPVVTAEDPTRHIEIVLNGLQGKTIQGTSYASPMPAWSDQLSNEEIAAVINHERTSWGNDAPTVTAEDVAKVRKGGSK